jgi:hypothetical protein
MWSATNFITIDGRTSARSYISMHSSGDALPPLTVNFFYPFNKKHMKVLIFSGNFNFHNDLFAVLRWNGSSAACLSLWLPTTDVNCSIGHVWMVYVSGSGSF